MKKNENLKIKNIAVMKFRNIGDALLTAPVFKTLKENFLSAQIYAAVNSGTEEALSFNPSIDAVIVYDRKIKKLGPLNYLKNEIKFFRALRDKKIDLAVDLTGGDRAAGLAFFSSAEKKIAWRAKGVLKKMIYDSAIEPDGRKHIILQNLEILNPLKLKKINYKLDFFIPEKDKEYIKKIFGRRNIKKENTVIHIHPVSRWLFKCWKDEYTADIISFLSKDENIKIIITASPSKKEIDKVNSIIQLVDENARAKIINLSGKTTLKQLGAVSLYSDIFFGVDTAAMHIAAALNKPAVALFGPSGAVHWGPWENNLCVKKLSDNLDFNSPYPLKNGVQNFGIHTVIQSARECVPCGKDGCGGSKNSRCLTEDITPGKVKNILRAKIDEIREKKNV